MATSSFKSTTRRPTPATSDSHINKKKNKPSSSSIIRRSQSVSAISRSQSEFVFSNNMRDNPLFSTTGIGAGAGTEAEDDEEEDNRRERGRSVSRNSETVNKKKEKKVVVDDVAKRRGRSVTRARSCAAPASESHLHRPDSEDAESTGSLTEGEEKTIKVFCEQMKRDTVGAADSPPNEIYETVRSEVKRAILDIQNDLETAVRANNTHFIAAANVNHNPPDSVHHGAVELVSDIRKEYVKKLEESKERASKLRADLAVEEHRVQEFNRILKEIIPDPKTTAHRSRPGRKRSNERKKMSNRLTEEAMAYFDECVSLSTLDSSDFSAPEDSPFSLVGASTPAGPTTTIMQDSSTVSTSCFPNNSLNHYQSQDSGCHVLSVHSHMRSGLTGSNSDEPVMKQSNFRGFDGELGRKTRFSFSQKPTETVGLQQDIRSYIKITEKEFIETASNLENVRANYYDVDRYMHDRGENLLFEMVLNRTESGTLHICGSMSILSSPFACII